VSASTGTRGVAAQTAALTPQPQGVTLSARTAGVASKRRRASVNGSSRPLNAAPQAARVTRRTPPPPL